MGIIYKVMKSFFVNLCVLVVALIFSLGMCEIAFRMLLKNNATPASEILSKERNYYLETLVGDRTAYVDTMLPHPYVGYVHDKRFKRWTVNNVGFLGQDYPYEKEEGVFVILVTGGSTASQFAGFSQEQNYLEKILNEKYTNDKIKRYVVLNGALGAWKQPQQLMLLSLYAPVIDGVISLEGYNEFGSLKGQGFAAPEQYFVAAMGHQFNAMQEFLPLILSSAILKIQKNSNIIDSSQLLSFMLTKIRHKLDRIYMNNRSSTSVKNRVNQIFYYPGSWSDSKKHEYSLSQYKHFLVSMNAVAKASNVEFLLLMQPTAVYGKQLTEKEQRVVSDLSFGNDYYQMVHELMDLKLSHQLPIYSLLDVFNGQTETMFEDSAHLSTNGNKILAEEIVNLLETEWGFKQRHEPSLNAA